jgi:hypothetical protein
MSLEVPNEILFELCPTTNALEWQKFKPCSNMLPNIDRKVLDDEIVIIRPTGSADETEVF